MKTRNDILKEREREWYEVVHVKKTAPLAFEFSKEDSNGFFGEKVKYYN